MKRTGRRLIPPTSGMPSASSGTDVAAHLDVGQAGQELAEHHRQLPTGEVGAQAEVRARAAEADVGVRVAADVERLGVVELARVAVGRAVEQHDLVALVEVVPRQRQVVS